MFKLNFKNSLSSSFNSIPFQSTNNFLTRKLTTIFKEEKKENFEIGRFNHIAIAVPDLKKAGEMYKNTFGAEISEIMHLPEHGVSTIFVKLANTKIELLHPLGEKSPIKGFLEKNPMGGIHHMCLEVENIQKAIKQMEKSNIKTIGKEPKIGAHNKPVIFLHPKSVGGVLIELEQNSN
ncbi:methylmalonyl-coa epimerase [Anaeramoeba ignava]|uniref:Methylmalonyl-CoA epimerase, mitochondrial n=1 Tax=Anaeramoeba ignava TaxID=1746090 RepID=A0A9Q0LNP6_ANAIG|nr:methylmalonyl-coa epimerase [Anaeramoeba ignava]KAJ5079182.1 methylmalonyl-coa epimerase [Anaeramoeba ignava]|eukprot:Anaeramoba_ignava/a611982_261.p1 GENE.a611982_261~~a611982_261.p1  ORF type:complete len:189 (+),score=65.11 a611982_261:36-569(+)